MDQRALPTHLSWSLTHGWLASPPAARRAAQTRACPLLAAQNVAVHTLLASVMCALALAARRHMTTCGCKHVGGQPDNSLLKESIYRR